MACLAVIDNENLLNKHVFCERFQLLIMILINNKDLGF